MGAVRAVWAEGVGVLAVGGGSRRRGGVGGVGGWGGRWGGVGAVRGGRWGWRGLGTTPHSLYLQASNACPNPRPHRLHPRRARPLLPPLTAVHRKFIYRPPMQTPNCLHSPPPPPSPTPAHTARTALSAVPVHPILKKINRNIDFACKFNSA